MLRMSPNFLIVIVVTVFRLKFAEGTFYTVESEVSDGMITKYLEEETEISCLLRCNRVEECDTIMFKQKNQQMRSGECWFVKKKSTDENDEGKIGKFKEDKSIKKFKKLSSCPAKSPCYFGKCADKNGGTGYECQCKGEWISLKRGVCFGTKANQFGTFKIPNRGVLAGIKLQHVGGTGVTCGAVSRTNWGCDAISNYDNKDNVGVAFTDDQNNILYPNWKFHIKHGYYNISGYNAYSPTVIFNSTNHTVYKEQELRLHYAETLFSANPSGNMGESCADVFAILCDE